MLIEFVERVLMRPRRLRKAIQAVVHENDELLRMLKDAEDEVPTNLTWAEEENGVWKGWTYNPEKKRYYFNDIGNESLMGLWEDQFLNEAEQTVGYGYDELKDFDMGYKGKKSKTNITPFLGEKR
jgi:hypothetical protein